MSVSMSRKYYLILCAHVINCALELLRLLVRCHVLPNVIVEHEVKPGRLLVGAVGAGRPMALRGLGSNYLGHDICYEQSRRSLGKSANREIGPPRRQRGAAATQKTAGVFWEADPPSPNPLSRENGHETALELVFRPRGPAGVGSPLVRPRGPADIGKSGNREIWKSGTMKIGES